MVCLVNISRFDQAADGILNIWLQGRPIFANPCKITSCQRLRVPTVRQTNRGMKGKPALIGLKVEVPCPSFFGPSAWSADAICSNHAEASTAASVSSWRKLFSGKFTRPAIICGGHARRSYSMLCVKEAQARLASLGACHRMRVNAPCAKHFRNTRWLRVRPDHATTRRSSLHFQPSHVLGRSDDVASGDIRFPRCAFASHPRQ